MITISQKSCVSKDNNKGLANPIFIKKSRFILLKSGVIQLSAMSSKTYNENRLASWAKVKDKITGKTLVICNGHLGTEKNIPLFLVHTSMRNFFKELVMDNILMFCPVFRTMVVGQPLPLLQNKNKPKDAN